MSETAKCPWVEVRDDKPHLRWGVYSLALAAVVLVSALINGLLLAAGVWSGVDTVLFGVLVGVVVFNIFVIYDFNKAIKTDATSHPPGCTPSTAAPPPQPPTGEAAPHHSRCPRCGAVLDSDAPEGLCPRCLLGLNLAPQTEISGDEIGPSGTKVVKPPPHAPLAAEAIAVHFPQLEILKCLGRGGMGVVYQARQPKLNRLVALKILAPEKGSDPKFAERFAREAQALARLNHPNIVTVHDFGEANGLYYLLMEYVDGASLRELLRTGQVKPEEALAIVPSICEALQYAHERGIVHRDIKPENVLLDKDGRVKIADFGIAKIVGQERPAEALTEDKQVVGTPHYMAPEQVEKPQLVDHRADIYSLGVVFYEMLTGELPLGKFQPPSRKVRVDVRLDEVVLHALEKEPERRYQNASEVKTDVEHIAQAPAPEAVNRPKGEPPRTTVATSAQSWQWFAPWVCLRNGQRVIHWPGVIQGTFLLAGLYTVVWFGVAMLLGPIAGTPHVGVLLGGIIGFVACMLALGLRRAFRVPLERLKPLDGHVPGVGGPQGAIRSTPMTLRVAAARWTARIFGTLLFAFYAFFVLAEGLPPIASQPGGVQLNFVALGFMLSGFLVGWKREGTAALLIATGWALWQVSEGSIRWNLFQTPVPVAVLYAFCWWATTRRTGLLATTTVLLALALAAGMVFMPTSVRLKGIVTDQVTRLPITNAELTLQQRAVRFNQAAPNARTDRAGHFSLYVGWYAPAKAISVTAPGYETLTTNLGPRPLGQRRIQRDFQLKPVRADATVAAAATSMLEHPAQQVPPVVVHTVPTSGSSEVDPTLPEIKVTFSTPMQDGSWSWSTVDPAQDPGGSGQPYYLPDQRTCVLPVRLQPGKVYALWLNSETFRNFRDQQGQAALPYLLIFQTKK